MSTSSDKTKKFWEAHLGVLMACLWGLLSAGLFLTGAFQDLDEYLNALIFQWGYQRGNFQSELLIVKKDERTYSVIQSDPEERRREFASIIRFVGQPREQAMPGSGEASLDLLDVRLGWFAAGKNPQVQTSFSPPLIPSPDSTWLFRVTEQLHKAPLFITGLPSLKTIASSTRLFQREELFQGSREAGELLELWALSLQYLLALRTEYRFRIFPKPDTLFQFQWRLVLKLPESYFIPPARVIGVDFLLQGAKDRMPEIDAALRSALASSHAPVVLAAQSTVEVGQGIDSRLDQAIKDSATSSTRTQYEREQQVSLILPHQSFLEVASHVAFIDVGQQGKGFVRRLPIFVYDPSTRRAHPSFSLLISALALDRKSPIGTHKPYQRFMEQELVRVAQEIASGTYSGGFQLNDITIPCDYHGYMEVRFFGSTQRIKESWPVIPSVSFYECFDEEGLDFYAQRTPSAAEKLKPANAHINTTGYQPHRNFGNKICLLGTFERSDFDFYETPLTIGTPFRLEAEKLMGIEIHANAIMTILQRKFLHASRPAHTILLMILGTLLLGIIIDHVKPLAGGLFTIGGVAGITALSYYAFYSQNQILYISPFIISFPMSWFSSTLIGYLQQQAKALSIKSMFQRFVSKDVVQYMIDHPEKVAPGGQRVELTVFFSDVAGFTSISEMLTPEELVVLLNEYLGAMTDILFEYGGTLDKFIGDAVMCFWNYPRAQEDHAVRACLCAIRMQEKIRELQIGWAKRGLPKVSARAGINTAQVVVGYMGSEKAQMNFTCMGDGVNLASRLEGANKEYGTDLMISDACYQQARHKVTARFLDFLAVKGKKEPVKVHHLVCEKGKEPPDWEEFVALYDKGIKQHLDRQWDDAIATFEALLARWPDDGPSKTYINRCKEYKENPPPENWDGSYHLTHK